MTQLAPRAQRADAQRNVDALLTAAKVVFASSGVDAPAKEICDKAGVGIGTLYRHFPLRSDLITAVLQHEVDACIEAGTQLSVANEPVIALTKWLQLYTEFVATKRGLGTALHSGDPAYEGLPLYLLERLTPTMTVLLDAAIAAGQIGADASADDLLRTVALLCMPGPDGAPYSQRMIAVLIDGLRYGARDHRA